MHAADAPYAVEPQFRLLRFGEVMPTGWIREQLMSLLTGVPAQKRAIKDFPVAGIHDYLFFPVIWGDARVALPKLAGETSNLAFSLVANPASDPRYPWDVAPARLTGKMVSLDNRKVLDVALVPMGSSEAILRRATFPVTP